MLAEFGGNHRAAIGVQVVEDLRSTFATSRPAQPRLGSGRGGALVRSARLAASIALWQALPSRAQVQPAPIASPLHVKGKGAYKTISRLEKDLIAALGRWIAQQPEPISRAEALRLALAEWLTEKGVMHGPDVSVFDGSAIRSGRLRSSRFYVRDRSVAINVAGCQRHRL